MRHHTGRGRVDPILASNEFGVARPLQPEDLDTRVTRQGIYPSLPAPNGVPWSEYVKVQRNRLSSISSSTEALESDQARYVTRRIVKHARSMVVGTRSLPTDSPIPYFQLIERGYMSEGSQEGIYTTPYVEPSVNTETDRVPIFTGLDDYDTLFAARCGRGALDPVPTFGDPKIEMSLDIPTPKAGPELINPREQLLPTYGEAVSIQKETRKSQTTPPGSEIIEE